MSSANVTETKAAVRKRDGYCCTRCGMTNEKCVTKYGHGLHVHRTTPGSPYSLAGCVTLCRECHRLAHRAINNAKPKRPRRGPVRLELSRAEHQLVRMAAAILGVSMAAFARKAVIDAISPPTLTQEADDETTASH